MRKKYIAFLLVMPPIAACADSVTTTRDGLPVEPGTHEITVAAGSDASSEPESFSEPASALDLPLAAWANFSYAGGFRLPSRTQTLGNVDYVYGGNRGSIEVARDRTRMFVGARMTTDGNGKMGWSQVEIPTLNPTDGFEDMPLATATQGLADVWNNVAFPNGPLNRSMHCIEYDGMLVGTMVHNYAGDNNYLIWRVEDSGDIANATIGGMYNLQGQYYAAGWIVEVPDEWKALVGYDHLMGNAHNFSISGRASIGPTFFGVDLSQVTAATPSEPIQTVEYMNYPRNKDKGLFVTMYPEKIETVKGNWSTTDRATYRDMHYNIMSRPHPTEFPPSHADYPDQDPNVLGNDIWTVTSRAGIGFIIPGTRTYAVFGKAAGMEHGVGYRIKNDVGREMSGPAPYVNADHYNFHWFFDMRDIVDSKNGLKKPWDILPYSYGRITLPFEKIPVGGQTGGTGKIFGGTFDSDNMRVYFAIRNYDSNKPLILAYDIQL